MDALLQTSDRGLWCEAGGFYIAPRRPVDHALITHAHADHARPLREDNEPAPVAKAYSGLSNAEIRKVDRFIRDHTTARHGPVHAVEPQLVFKLGFEHIQPSTRHKAGLAVRFLRMLRQHDDKSPEAADTLETLQALLAEVHPSTR